MAGSGVAGDSLAGSSQAGDALAGSALLARGFGRPEPDPDAADYIGRGFSLGGRTAPSADLPRRAGAEPREAAQSGATRSNRDPAPLTPPSSGCRCASGRPASRPSCATRRPRQAPRPADSPCQAPSRRLAPGRAPQDRAPQDRAPQDRAPSRPAQAESSPTAGPIPATPEAARNTMSALQRGWQLGRSEAEIVADASISVFTRHKSPTGQAFGPDDSDADSTDTGTADSGDERVE